MISGNDVFLRDGILKNSADVSISNLNDFLKVLAIGESKKKYAETKMNNHSSRAHTLIMVHISQTPKSNKSIVTNSTLFLVDLAGCEQIKKSDVKGINLLEAMHINKGLLCLGRCISSLVQNSKHVPYYDSKLTQLLKNCFGGNCRTNVIINASADDSNGNQTLQALWFGEHCSMISNVTKNASESIHSALDVIDETLRVVLEGMNNLKNKNMTHLKS